MGAGAAPMQSAEQSVKRSRRIQKYSLLLKTPAHANTHHTPRRAFRGPEAATEGTGGQSRCREDSGAVSRKSLSGGPEAATEGTGGPEPRPGGLGAEAAAESSRSVDPIRAAGRRPTHVASRSAGPDAGLTARRAGGGARLRTLAPEALHPDEVARPVDAAHERRGVAFAEACALMRDRGADGADEGVAAAAGVDEVVVRVGFRVRLTNGHKSARSAREEKKERKSSERAASSRALWVLV